MSGTSYNNAAPSKRNDPVGVFSEWMAQGFFGQPIGIWLLFVATITLFLVVWGMFLKDIRERLGKI